jgi:plastocyanin
MKKQLIIFSAVLGLALILTACGGGGASTKIDVTLTDFQFDPMEFTVPAGQEITINATMKGQCCTSSLFSIMEKMRENRSAMKMNKISSGKLKLSPATLLPKRSLPQANLESTM